MQQFSFPLLSPRLRQLVLTAHIIASIGWLGAVAVFLMLAVVGLTHGSPQTVQAAYITMDLMTSYTLVPLSVAALLTGIVQGLGTRWGLFQHAWIVAKLTITVVSTAILFSHVRSITYLAVMAAGVPFSAATFHELRIQMVTTSGAALATLIGVTLLSVIKPPGLTPYGRFQRRT